MTSRSPQHTQSIGAALGRLLQPGDCIALSGQLGAGKTALCRAIGSGWGAQPPLSSPTYNLVHEHRRTRDAQRLQHIDLYRIDGGGDAASIGLDDMLADEDILLIEWAERLPALLCEPSLQIKLQSLDDDKCQLHARAQGLRHARLLAEWQTSCC